MDELKFDKNRFRIKECPCGKSNKDGKFVPYIGYDNKGYCHSCGDTFLPDLKPIEKNSFYKPVQQRTRPEQKPISMIPFEVMKQSLDSVIHARQMVRYSEIQAERISENKCKKNHFVSYLDSLFGPDITDALREKYLIGTSNHWSGANTFWQMDIHGNVRTGKIFVYSPITGKRIKEPTDMFYWEHKALNRPEFNFKQCFFGEHLLKGNVKPVAIVESEKSAVIASVYFPEYIWLGASGKFGLNAEKCNVLKGRKVLLFPDLSKPDDKDNAFELWTNKAKEYSYITNFVVSDLLEVNASEEERMQALDIADYLLKKSFNDFSKIESKPLIQN